MTKKYKQLHFILSGIPILEKTLVEIKNMFLKEADDKNIWKVDDRLYYLSKRFLDIGYDEISQNILDLI